MEGRDAAKRSAMHRTEHHNREFNQSDMSTVPRLGNLPARLRKRKGKETNPQERVHGFFRTCWLETLEASWVESETGLHKREQGETKERGRHSKGTYWIGPSNRHLFSPITLLNNILTNQTKFLSSPTYTWFVSSTGRRVDLPTGPPE